MLKSFISGTLLLALMGLLLLTLTGLRVIHPVISSQETEYTSPGMVANHASMVIPQGNFISATIPLKRAGRLFMLEAVIDGQVGNFILDTGAKGLVLNQTYFRNVIVLDDEEGAGVTGSTGPVNRTWVRRLEVSGLTFEHVAADVINLGHIENRRGVKVLGLFGMSLLRNLEIVLDVSNNELQLHQLDKSGNRIGKNIRELKFDMIQKLEENRNILEVKIQVGGKLLSFCLDTGAESNVLDINLPQSVLRTVSITRRSNLHGAGSAKMEVLYGTLTDFVFGGCNMKEMNTILTNLRGISAKYGCVVSGMLGYDFFERGIICINLVKNEIGISLRPGQNE